MDNSNNSSGKRKREEPQEKEKGEEKNKCSVQEGYSWWTCLMYDMPKSMTKPQPQKKSDSS